MIDDQLKVTCNMDLVTKKFHQRLKFMRIFKQSLLWEGVLHLNLTIPRSIVASLPLKNSSSTWPPGFFSMTPIIITYLYLALLCIFQVSKLLHKVLFNNTVKMHTLIHNLPNYRTCLDTHFTIIGFDFLQSLCPIST